MRKLLRAPALHFIVIGALLFALEPASRVAEPGHAMTREPIVITAARRAQIRDIYTRETGLPAGPANEAVLLEREIGEELLYREALAHGLHLHDRSIRWRLISKMEFLASHESSDEAPTKEGGSAGVAVRTAAGTPGAEDQEELYRQAIELGLDRDDAVIKRILAHKIRLLIRLQADDDAPDEATLRQYYAAHENDFLQPDRVTFSHVFASRDKRGERAESDMRVLLGELVAGHVPPRAAIGRADPFQVGHHYRSRSRAGVAKIFGTDFADAVLAARPGQWSGPFRSAYGWHAVWVDSRDTQHVADFDEVRSRVFQRYVNERRTAYLDETLARLRDEYEIIIEPDDDGEGGS